jgi:hypothetical protein
MLLFSISELFFYVQLDFLLNNSFFLSINGSVSVWVQGRTTSGISLLGGGSEMI